MLGHIVGDFAGMPELMKRLALAQFFSWSALFIMWINTTPVVAQYFYGSADAASPAYQEGANWVGVLFTTYNGVAAIAALTLLPLLAAGSGGCGPTDLRLLCGAAGYASFFFLKDPQMLIAQRDRRRHRLGLDPRHALRHPRLRLPQRKLGIYMGLFNVFVVVPQLLVATVMGSIMKRFFPDEPIWTMAFAAGAMVLAALAMLRVEEPARCSSPERGGGPRAKRVVEGAPPRRGSEAGPLHHASHGRPPRSGEEQRR